MTANTNFKNDQAEQKRRDMKDFINAEGTPKQKYDQTMSEYKDKLDSGHITQAQFEQAKKNARRRMEGTGQTPGYVPTESSRFLSRGAPGGASGGGGSQKVEQSTEDIAASAKNQEKLLGQIVAALKPGTTITIAGPKGVT